MKKPLFFLLLVLSAVRGLAQIPAYVPTSGLVAWYPFSGNANDSSGSGINGIDSGATLTTDRFCNANRAYWFNGVNSFIYVPHNAALDLTASFSISFWFCPDYTGRVSGQMNHMIVKGSNSTNEYSIIADDITTKIVRFNKQGVQAIAISPDTIANNVWVNITATYTYPVAKLYLNGIRVDTGIILSPYIAHATALFIGTIDGTVSPDSTSPSLVTKGKMDDIAIYNRELTPEEVTGLYDHYNTFSAATVAGPSTLCVGSSITLSGAATGGSWVSTNSHASVSSPGVVLGISAGTDLISYAVTNSCGTYYATKEVTVNPAPNAGTISGLDSLCVGSSAIYTDTAIGGEWSSSNSSVSTVSAAGAVAALVPGIDTISYTVTNSDFGCSTTTSFPVKVLSYSACAAGVRNTFAEEASEISIVPNPAYNSIAITSTGKIFSLSVCNLLGQTVYSGQYGSEHVQVDITGLPPGLYIARINGTEVRKFVKR